MINIVLKKKFKQKLKFRNKRKKEKLKKII